MKREILGYECRKCGEINYPYRMVCRKCRENEFGEFDPVPLPKRGRLLTFTHLYTLPGDFEVARLALGIVELENGIRITGQLAIDDPRTGMPVEGKVEVVRSPDYERCWGMVFYPA